MTEEEHLWVLVRSAGHDISFCYFMVGRRVGGEQRWFVENKTIPEGTPIQLEPLPNTPVVQA